MDIRRDLTEMKTYAVHEYLGAEGHPHSFSLCMEEADPIVSDFETIYLVSVFKAENWIDAKKRYEDIIKMRWEYYNGRN